MKKLILLLFFVCSIFPLRTFANDRYEMMAVPAVVLAKSSGNERASVFILDKRSGAVRGCYSTSISLQQDGVTDPNAYITKCSLWAKPDNPYHTPKLN